MNSHVIWKRISHVKTRSNQWFNTILIQKNFRTWTCYQQSWREFVRSDICQTCICLGLPTSLMWCSWTLLLTCYFAEGRFCQGRKDRQILSSWSMWFSDQQLATFLGSNHVKGCHWTIYRSGQNSLTYGDWLGWPSPNDVVCKLNQFTVQNRQGYLRYGCYHGSCSNIFGAGLFSNTAQKEGRYHTKQFLPHPASMVNKRDFFQVFQGSGIGKTEDYLMSVDLHPHPHPRTCTRTCTRNEKCWLSFYFKHNEKCFNRKWVSMCMNKPNGIIVLSEKILMDAEVVSIHESDLKTPCSSGHDRKMHPEEESTSCILSMSYPFSCFKQRELLLHLVTIEIKLFLCIVSFITW